MKLHGRERKYVSSNRNRLHKTVCYLMQKAM
jgi:hypothetical protein